MIRWMLLFLVIAFAVAITGFSGIAGAAAGIARFIFFLFLVLFLVSLGRQLLEER